MTSPVLVPEDPEDPAVASTYSRYSVGIEFQDSAVSVEPNQYVTQTKDKGFTVLQKQIN